MSSHKYKKKRSLKAESKIQSKKRKKIKEKLLSGTLLTSTNLHSSLARKSTGVVPQMTYMNLNTN